MADWAVTQPVTQPNVCNCCLRYAGLPKSVVTVCCSGDHWIAEHTWHVTVCAKWREKMLHEDTFATQQWHCLLGWYWLKPCCTYTLLARVFWQAVCAVCVACADTPLLSRFASSLPEGKDATLEALTSTYPLRRMATPQEIGEAAVWVCTKATYMTGHTLVLDGGSGCT
jgi:hypothetical protein